MKITRLSMVIESGIPDSGIFSLLVSESDCLAPFEPLQCLRDSPSPVSWLLKLLPPSISLQPACVCELHRAFLV